MKLTRPHLLHPSPVGVVCFSKPTPSLQQASTRASSTSPACQHTAIVVHRPGSCATKCPGTCLLETLARLGAQRFSCFYSYLSTDSRVPELDGRGWQWSRRRDQWVWSITCLWREERARSRGSGAILFQSVGSSYDSHSPCRLLLIPVHVCWLEYGRRHIGKVLSVVLWTCLSVDIIVFHVFWSRSLLIGLVWAF